MSGPTDRRSLAEWLSANARAAAERADAGDAAAVELRERYVDHFNDPACETALGRLLDAAKAYAVSTRAPAQGGAR